jgi:hypothetical protein
MTSLRTALLALALVTPLAACTAGPSDGDTEFRDVVEFVDGMALTSDDGAFRIVLSSDDGKLGTGRNDLIVRVGFHDPMDPEAEGRGIPGATLDVDAWMPDTEVAMQSDIQVSYLGDGAYAVDNVVLDRAGVWNVDIDITVGQGMHETVTLAFEVTELGFR